MIIGKKILYGICGIGNGHTFRQFPILQTLSQHNKIVLFVYDSSYEFYSKYFENNKNVYVHQVTVPFYNGNSSGLDFEGMLNNSLNQTRNFFEENCKAFALADKIIGKPDIVISDYEPVSAQYAYAYNSPLVTIDQQSKYLYEDSFENIGNLSIKDEVMRLRMFFPKADKRIACSFFDFEKNNSINELMIMPPVFRSSIKNLKRDPDNVSILVYITSNQKINQSLHQISKILGARSDFYFHVFIPKSMELPHNIDNVKFYSYGDSNFDCILSQCKGIISTAGHNLLSEAMYLGIPVYAMPLDIYEQQMNAKVINDNKFGVMNTILDKATLNTFLDNLDLFENNIKNDSKVLLREDGYQKILELLKLCF